jgi:DNA-binding NarL/FixJ family response regulator
MAKRAERRSVGVLSEHVLYRYATAEVLRRHGYRVDEYETHAQLSQRALDAVVVDLDHARQDTRSLMRHVRERNVAEVIPLGSALRLAAALAHRDRAVVETPHADARALVAAIQGKRSRPSTELARQGRMWTKLTTRQSDVLRWLGTGLDNRAIGWHLGTGERAVKQHVSALLVVFGFTNRAQLALTAHASGLRPSGRSSLSSMSRPPGVW